MSSVTPDIWHLQRQTRGFLNTRWLNPLDRQNSTVRRPSDCARVYTTFVAFSRWACWTVFSNRTCHTMYVYISIRICRYYTLPQFEASKQCSRVASQFCTISLFLRHRSPSLRTSPIFGRAGVLGADLNDQTKAEEKERTPRSCWNRVWGQARSVSKMEDGIASLNA